MNENEGTELTEIDVFEVSLVGKPANKRSFLLLKSEGGEVTEEITEEEIEKNLSEHDANAVKGALNLLKRIPSLKSIVDSLNKLVKGDLTKEEPMEEVKVAEKVEDPKVEKADVEIQKKIEALEQELKAVVSRAETAETKVSDLEKANRIRELTEIAKNFVGDAVENLAYLEGLSESLPKDKFDAVIEREKLHATRERESELFVEKGKTTPNLGTAEDKLNKVVEKNMADGLDMAKAIEKAVKDNPDLYEDSRKEANAKK